MHLTRWTSDTLKVALPLVSASPIARITAPAFHDVHGETNRISTAVYSIYSANRSVEPYLVRLERIKTLPQNITSVDESNGAWMDSEERGRSHN